jgi:2-isopropylmalate synthase
MSKDVFLYDSTLRDGAQTEGISFTVDDKVKIARRLDEFGIDYIEAGWPGANPTDVAFFERAGELGLRHARIAGFGSTRRARLAVEDDPQVRQLAELGTPVITIVAKAWDLHVEHVLRTTREQNLAMIDDTVRYLKSGAVELIVDSEHFFDAYRADSGYALETLRVAAEAGADRIVLCDTNGGTLPDEMTRVIAAVRAVISTPLGIHAHNDADVAVANSLAAVTAGVDHVQGTINGYGERCGNANLCSIVAALQLKMGKRCVEDEALVRLYELSHYVAEMVNMPPLERQPYVGRSAFAHKGGLHVDAVMKRPEAYEHIRPERVGNQRRLLVSDQSGGSAILERAGRLEIELAKDAPETRAIIARVKEMEHEGYQFEAAEASFELLMKKSIGIYRSLFDLHGFRVIVEKRPGGEIISEATIKVNVEGRQEHTAAEGDGPVHALDGALRKALEPFYPELRAIRLTDFKVRVLAGSTAAKVRVLVESADETDSWSTVGVHENIIEASWQALVDSVEYGLLKRGVGGPAGGK